MHTCMFIRWPSLHKMAHFKVQGLSASTTNASVLSRLRKRAPLFLGFNTILPLSRSQYPCNQNIAAHAVCPSSLSVRCTAAERQSHVDNFCRGAQVPWQWWRWLRGALLHEQH